MNREDWKFPYLAGDLAAAATKKKERHESRLAWWKVQQQAVIDEVREKGLEVSESLAMQYGDSKAFTGSGALRGAQLVVKNDYQTKLNECHMKIGQHAERVSTYDGWAQMLAANPDARVELDIDDWLFFFSC